MKNVYKEAMKKNFILIDNPRFQLINSGQNKYFIVGLKKVGAMD